MAVASKEPSLPDADSGDEIARDTDCNCEMRVTNDP